MNSNLLWNIFNYLTHKKIQFIVKSKFVQLSDFVNMIKKDFLHKHIQKK